MMKTNERLREAARAGSEVRLKALLREPGGNALSQGEDGWTALMYAARYGYEGCVQLLLPASDAWVQDGYGRTALIYAALHKHKECVHILLPVSDALATDRQGLTASMWARKGGHGSLAQLIDAYVQAQSERAALGVAVSPGAPHGRAAFRM